VLDAMPTHGVRWDHQGPIPGVLEQGVGLVDDHLVTAERPASAALLTAVNALPVVPPFRSEISLAARAWVSELARHLEKGAMLLIDYGLPRHELYHPQRDGGTLRCHYRHRVHDDPFWLPGLCDITSHVDFTAVAEAGFEAGLDVLGYTSQANFLINCGIGELLTDTKVGADNTATKAELRARGAVNVLISPNEMGELFKVIALGRNVSGPLIGFARGDRVHTL
jgi:SAM-dependent MidA family methyltransferase